GYPTPPHFLRPGWDHTIPALRNSENDLVQCKVRMERGVFAGVADADDKFAGIDGPLMRRVVPVAEGAGVQVESYMPGFAGSQTNLLKAFQLALRAAEV